MRLGREAQDVLIRLARDAIAAWLEEERRLGAPTRPAVLEENRGVFVTLRNGAELRGCIGYPLPSQPLGAAVVDAAIAAATADPRFPVVAADELERLSLEVSVLTPPVSVAADEVVVGRDGLVIELDGRRGLLLPQVASENGWQRADLLAGVCLKAGLPAQAWLDPHARLERFEAEVFGER